MLYSSMEIYVILLLLPAVLNIVLPLAILTVWLFKQLFVRLLPTPFLTNRGQNANRNEMSVSA